MSYRHLRNARGFFSDYYLGSVFGRDGGRGRKRKLSDKTSEAAYARFRKLFDRVSGREFSAPECRELFLRPLLRDVFGFLLGEGAERLYPLVPAPTGGDEIAEPAPAVAVAWLGALEDDLDAGRGKHAPRKEIEAELARSGRRYGLLATGERLRLVRAPGEGPAGAYLEIDLAGLAADPDPESFAVALKLLDPRNFAPAADGALPIDAIERESRKHAEKVSEDLKTAVFRAAESLVAGLLADAADRGAVADPVALSREELGRYRDAALLALYRLLFILYAEARDPRLDEHAIYKRSYSAQGLVEDLLADPLRAWPENRSGLWARLVALFEIYDRGLPPIDPWRNIPPRGGDFFKGDTPAGELLARARLSDAAVARLVLDLATTTPRRGIGRERVSFRELDIENLGAVYEGLLEFEPKVAAVPTLELRVQGRLFALAPEDAARLCETKKLMISGPIEWVAGTPAERFHPEGEDEEAEVDGEEAEDQDEPDEAEEEADEGDEGEEEKGLKRGGSAKLLRRLEQGEFHFVPGPGRKGSGSFYTPLPLVQDLVRHALGPVSKDKSVAEIEALRVLDPACGSGHFLVEAMRFLGQELHRAYVREYGGKAPPNFRSTTDLGWDADVEAPDADARAAASEARAWCKRRIAERCLFGVDSNSTAVTLAHVALWIESSAGDRPLTYFEHHVRCGNSLLGSWLDRLAEPPVPDKKKNQAAQIGLFGEEVKAAVREAAKLRRMIDTATPEDLAREGIDAESLEEQQYKESLRGEAERNLAGARRLFDLRSASLFAPELWEEFQHLYGYVAKPQEIDRLLAARERLAPLEDLRARYRFFHWELEFPEVFLGTERHGFDAVLGNPPWDKVLPERHAFYARFDPLIRAFKGAELDQRIRELHALHSGLEKQFELFQRETKFSAQFLRASGDFPHAEARSQAAHEDLSKYFLDRAARLAAPGGAVGFLVPSVIYNGDGCVGLRRYLLTETRIERFYAFENRRKLFPIDSRYKFVNLVFRKGAPPAAFAAAFMRHDPEELTVPGPQPWLVNLTREEIELYSPETFAFLEYRSPRDQGILAKMHEGNPTLGMSPDEPGSWGAGLIFWRAHSLTFNVTDDRGLWTDPKSEKAFTPLTVLGYTPSTFAAALKEMDGAGFSPVFEGGQIDQFLLGIKPVRWWLSRALFKGKYGTDLAPGAVTVFRDMARNTDERTCIAAVLPRGAVASYTLTGLVARRVKPGTVASVLNSLAFDFAARLRVAGTHLSGTYLEPLPVPTAEAATGLPAFSTLHGWEDGTENVHMRPSCWEALWTINRAVAEAYGLNASDFEHILGDFPVMARKRKGFFAYLKKRVEEWKAEERSTPALATPVR